MNCSPPRSNTTASIGPVLSVSASASATVCSSAGAVARSSSPHGVTTSTLSAWSTDAQNGSAPHDSSRLMPRGRSGRDARLQHEDLEGARGVEDDLAVVGQHATPRDLADHSRRDRGNRLLEGEAVAANLLFLAV